MACVQGQGLSVSSTASSPARSCSSAPGTLYYTSDQARGGDPGLDTTRSVGSPRYRRPGDCRRRGVSRAAGDVSSTTRHAEIHAALSCSRRGFIMRQQAPTACRAPHAPRHHPRAQISASPAPETCPPRAAAAVLYGQARRSKRERLAAGASQAEPDTSSRSVRRCRMPHTLSPPPPALIRVRPWHSRPTRDGHAGCVRLGGRTT